MVRLGRQAAALSCLAALLAASMGLTPVPADGLSAPGGASIASSAPVLMVKYTYPGTSCVTGPARPAVASVRPSLYAIYSQIDGHNVDVHFVYGQVGGAMTWRWVQVGSGGTASYQIPEGQMVDGRSYQWQTIAKDAATGEWSAASSWCEFTVDDGTPKFLRKSTTPATSCVTGSGRPAISTARPTLSAAYSQIHGHNVDVHFEYGEVGGGTTWRWVQVAAGATASYQIPAGELVNGRSYRWQTIAKDAATGVWSGQSGWCEFTVGIWAPPVSGCPGTVTERADFNGDGYVDMAIGDPLRATSGIWESGAVTIVDGRTGVQTTLDQNLAEVPDTTETSDRFGSSLAVVDLNRDGCADLAIGTPYEDLTVADAGQVDILYGTPTGLGKGPAAETFIQGVGRTPGAQSAYDWFGFSLAAGQTSGNEPYVIIGAPGDDAGGAADAGTATYVRGEYRIAIDQSLVSGQVNETDDRFGTAVAATANQLAISMPGESLSAANQFAGRVCAFTHTITDNRLDLVMCFSQSDFGVNGFEAGDEFGKSLSMAPYRTVAGGSIDSILLIGAPGEDNAGLDDVGVTHSYKVTGSAVSLLSTNWKTGGQIGDHFGEKVLVVNLDPAAAVTDAKLIAAVGAPGRDASASILDSGEVRVFPAGKSGTLGYDVSVAPGTATERTLIGVAVGGNGTHLFAPSVYQGTKSVYAIKWTDLVAGTATTDTAATVAAPTGSIAFGAQVG